MESPRKSQGFSGRRPTCGVGGRTASAAGGGRLGETEQQGMGDFVCLPSGKLTQLWEITMLSWVGQLFMTIFN